jgi:Ca2+-binding EF-hand superfamily protein
MKMTKTRKIVLGLSLAATAVAGAAYAEQATKGDGVLTRAEAQAKAQEVFARMDVNKDGKIDQADRAARHAAMFDRMDADHNGQISRAEFDATGPGAHGPRGPEAGGPDGDRGPGKHGWGHRGGPGGGHRGGGMMMGRMADADKDGTITQAEFTQAALQRFDRADANHDGTVTKEERQAARQAMRQQWQNRSAQPDAAKPN